MNQRTKMVVHKFESVDMLIERCHAYHTSNIEFACLFIVRHEYNMLSYSVKFNNKSKYDLLLINIIKNELLNSKDLSKYKKDILTEILQVYKNRKV